MVNFMICFKCERRWWFPAAKTMISDAFDIRSHWLPINNIFMMTSNGRWMMMMRWEWKEDVKGMMLWHHYTKNKDVIKMIFDTGGIIKMFLFRLNWMTAKCESEFYLRDSAGRFPFAIATLRIRLVCFDGRKLFLYDGKGGCLWEKRKPLSSFFRLVFYCLDSFMMVFPRRFPQWILIVERLSIVSWDDPFNGHCLMDSKKYIYCGQTTARYFTWVELSWDVVLLCRQDTEGSS